MSSEEPTTEPEAAAEAEPVVAPEASAEPDATAEPTTTTETPTEKPKGKPKKPKGKGKPRGKRPPPPPKTRGQLPIEELRAASKATIDLFGAQQAIRASFAVLATKERQDISALIAADDDHRTRARNVANGSLGAGRIDKAMAATIVAMAPAEDLWIVTLDKEQASQRLGRVRAAKQRDRERDEKKKERKNSSERVSRDQRLRLHAIQSPLGERLLADVPEDLRLESAHLIDGEGQLFSGGEAAAPIAAALPRLAPTAPLLRRLSRPVNASYNLIAANRVRIGRLVGNSSRERADRAIAAHQVAFGSEAQ